MRFSINSFINNSDIKSVCWETLSTILTFNRKCIKNKFSSNEKGLFFSFDSFKFAEENITLLPFGWWVDVTSFTYLPESMFMWLNSYVSVCVCISVTIVLFKCFDCRFDAFFFRKICERLSLNWFQNRQKPIKSWCENVKNAAKRIIINQRT